MTHHEFVVVLAIRRRSHRCELLIVRRGAGRYMGESWQLVTGRIEPEETAWRAAQRELREETGLEAAELYRLSTLTSFYRADDDSLNVAPMFCAVVDAGTVVDLNHENTAYEWIDVEHAPARLMWPADRSALEEARAVILNDGPAKPFLRIPTA